MFILDSLGFRKALKEKGFRSVGALARTIGLHRNTLQYYLSGRRILPAGFEKVLRALDLKPGEILIQKREEMSSSPLQAIAPLVDTLHSEFPQVTFILFGSRARGKAQKYSDWDLGAFSKEDLPHSLFRRMVLRKNEVAEDLPFFVDLVNFNRADPVFLKECSRNWMLMAGRQQDWLELQNRVRS